MTFKDLSKCVCNDLKNNDDITTKLILTSFLYDPGFRLLLNYRLGKYLSSSKWIIIRLISHRLKIKQLTKRHCQISYNATIGKGVKFPHPLGIIIGDGVVIKENVKIWQQVSLGSHGKAKERLHYPVVEENVKIFAGVKILGGITIGRNSVIGANSVVLNDVPENCLAVGIPARILKKDK